MTTATRSTMTEICVCRDASVKNEPDYVVYRRSPKPDARGMIQEQEIQRFPINLREGQYDRALKFAIEIATREATVVLRTSSDADDLVEFDAR